MIKKLILFIDILYLLLKSLPVAKTCKTVGKRERLVKLGFSYIQLFGHRVKHGIHGKHQNENKKPDPRIPGCIHKT